MNDSILSIRDLSRSFGGIQAVEISELTINQGSIVGLIGPNGAGKSTLFDLITGFQAPDRGRIIFQDQEITALPTHRIARMGLVRTFQIPRALFRMTVLENMMLGGQNQSGERIWNPIIRPRAVQEEEKALKARAEEVLKLCSLERMRDEYAGALSGGQKKLLELARALMADPKLLLLDEPFAGVNPTLSQSLLGLIKDLRDKGLTIMIIEHGIPYVLALADEIYVLNKGSVLAHGPPDEVLSDRRVLDAYLGDSGDAGN